MFLNSLLEGLVVTVFETANWKLGCLGEATPFYAGVCLLLRIESPLERWVSIGLFVSAPMIGLAVSGATLIVDLSLAFDKSTYFCNFSLNSNLFIWSRELSVLTAAALLS